MTSDEEKKINEARRIRDEADRNLRAAQQALDAAERQIRMERQRALRPVAELAHSLFCRYNHTDGCGWGYEIDNRKSDLDASWDKPDHRRWLDKVEELGKKMPISPEQLMEVLRSYEALAAAYPQLTRLLSGLRGI